MYRNLIFAVLLLLLPIAAFSQSHLGIFQVRHNFVYPINQFFLCTDVIDGSKIVIKINDEEELVVRLIGVNTPELNHPRKPKEYFATEARNFTRRTVLKREVRLEYEATKWNKLGELMAYVYRDDEVFLNEELIIEGFGKADLHGGYREFEKFKRYENEARSYKMGLWAEFQPLR